MQKLTITIATPYVDNGKIAYKREKISAVVASTKSQNNFVDDLRKQNQNVVSVEVKDLFIDRRITLDGIRQIIDTQIADVETQKAVFEHLVKVLDGGCIFKK